MIALYRVTGTFEVFVLAKSADEAVPSELGWRTHMELSPDAWRRFDAMIRSEKVPR